MNILIPRQKIINSRFRVGSEAFRKNRQQMVQVGFRIQAVGFRGFQHTKDNHTGIGSALCIAEKPVLPANHNRPDGVLHLVVADLYFTVVEEGAKILPLMYGVTNRILQLAGRFENGFQPGIIIVDNGLG